MGICHIWSTVRGPKRAHPLPTILVLLHRHPVKRRPFLVVLLLHLLVVYHLHLLVIYHLHLLVVLLLRLLVIYHLHLLVVYHLHLLVALLLSLLTLLLYLTDSLIPLHLGFLCVANQHLPNATDAELGRSSA